MSFWKDFSFASPVDDILKKKTFTLQELLDEDDVVVETRNQKQELLDFLLKEENMAQLVAYAVDDPHPEHGEKEKFRYPAVAGEILASEVDEMDNVLLNNENLLDKIFLFFNKPTINILLATVVSRIATSLLHTKAKEIFAYLKRKPEIIDGLLSHLETPATVECITRLLNLETESEGKDSAQWLVEIGFTHKLLSKFGPECAAIHADVASAVQDIITIALPSSPIIIEMITEKEVEYFLTTILEPTNPTAFKYGGQIVTRLLKHVCYEFTPPNDDELMDNHDERSFKRKKTKAQNVSLDKTPPYLRDIIARLGILRKYLQEPPPDPTIPVNMEVKVFGFYRLRILEIVSVLSLINYEEVNNALLNSGILKVILEQFFEFSHNNFCHKLIEQIFRNTLEGLEGVKLKELLETTSLPQLLMQADAHSKQNKNSQYQPFAHGIALDLNALVENYEDEIVKALLDKIEGWKEYITSLCEQQKRVADMSGTNGQISHYADAFFSMQSPSRESNTSAFSKSDDYDDDDDDDALLEDNDMDSSNDEDDYDVEQAEILLSKSEIENLAS